MNRGVEVHHFPIHHTQSTHTSGGCASGGGLDDRFDIMLMSGQILEDSGMVSYIPNSYKAVGNDGDHYNLSLLDGTNTSAPAAVLTALYDMSDHLPVIADLSINLLESPVDTSDTLIGISSRAQTANNWNIDVYDQVINVLYSGNGGIVQVTDLSGRLVVSARKSKKSEWLDLSHLHPGFYVVTGKDHESSLSRKIFIGN